MMNKFLPITTLILISFAAFGQYTATPKLEMPKVPAMRQLNHDYIDNSQKKIAALDGITDSLFITSGNDSINFIINDALINVVDNLQCKIELSKKIDDNTKYKWLRGVNDMLTSYQSGYKAKLYKGITLYHLILAYDEAMELDWEGKSFYNVVANNDFEVGEILINNYALKTNEAATTTKDVILLKKIYRYPKRTMLYLTQHPNASFADSIIISLAYKDPEQLYNYAAAPNALGNKIQSVQHPLVKQIALLASMKTGRMYFPFLDDLYKGVRKMEDITKVLNDSTGYYKLLVNTQIAYSTRLRNGDTPLVMKVLTQKLAAKAREFYITEINALHEQPDKIHFACLTPLAPQDLYYVAVLGEEEIYTSSYLGVYKNIFAKMKTPVADTLLKWVNYDYYKKFLKIAANYNTLDDFLSRMDNGNAEKLMRSFVSGLEKTNSLEDAVDVANSYASIYNVKIRNLILNQIEKNLEESEINQNTNGQTIYNLLNIIFKSMDEKSKIDLPSRLGITGVYEMPFKELQDSTGDIIIQQFFYGDKDGKGVFNSFLRLYTAPTWKRVDKESWVELHTTFKGKRISIYCNKPFDNEQDLDVKAQAELGRYLEENGLYPTIIIHRGHSYFVESTIEQLPTSAKVILLGSCGGYQKLTEVLDICPSAHIISSKQTGTGAVNIALINAITSNLRQGKNLNWPLIWKSLEPQFGKDSKEKFDDYVPPHKNLGAIFIMAYNIAMQNKNEQETNETESNN